MDREIRVNQVEKQRLRASISDDVHRFLQRGGRITVLDTGAARSPNYRGSVWFVDNDASEPAEPLN